MTPLLFALLLGIAAAALGLIMLWSALPRVRVWQVTSYVCGTKHDFKLADSNELVVLVIERDISHRSNEERAWCKELASGTRTPLPPDDARHLIATFTRAAKE